MLITHCLLAPVEVVSDRDKLGPMPFRHDDQRARIVTDRVGKTPRQMVVIHGAVLVLDGYPPSARSLGENVQTPPQPR